MTTAARTACGHLVAGPSSQLGKLSNSIFCSLTAPGAEWTGMVMVDTGASSFDFYFILLAVIAHFL